MSNTIFTCLFLVVLLQYGDAWKSHYLDPILTSLQRIEGMLVRQADGNSLNCVIPCDKLFTLTDESEEADSSNQSPSPTFLNVRRALNQLKDDDFQRRALNQLNDDDFQRRALRKQKRRSLNRNENVNMNTNTNTNSNYNDNRAKLLDFSDEHM